MFAEVARSAANAVIAKQAAAARLLLVADQLAKCREENNPYNWLGQPTPQAMWGPDPCEELEREKANLENILAGEKSLPQAAAQSASNAPNAENLAAAPAPQLATAYDPVGNTDPAIPESEFSDSGGSLQNVWSPITIDSLMEEIFGQVDWDQLEEEMQQAVFMELGEIEDNVIQSRKWYAWAPGKKQKKLKFMPDSLAWVGKWAP